MTSTLDPSHKQIEMWRRATGSEGGLDEYRNWVLENSMRFTAYGIHTVIVEGEAKHITALDDVTLCNEWAKLKRENNRLYAANEKICSGWRGFVLRLLGITLSCRKPVILLGADAKNQNDAVKGADL
ncbi:hypothetical protein JGC76_23615 [Salmonella enterica subsp. enterica serovar Corvallis]|jgi:hypothetical protein|uniref:Uncharacterized protein n=40 Tax=Enterobacterales TaxID=91347 RepID=A0A142CPW4_ECOLX|nr:MULTISPECIES: hypothetical protein [Enterobacterales]EAM7401691.1 hypothetical protein [Salmonella enterica subsp. enterica serovar Johannesburg]EAP4555268.1 hypothetical protein [Salmonella enterica subsp. enterica serovar Uganda]EAW5223011.1 hypothetical protein [Salmonella enterica subsp. enterica serovar Kunzendorf]EBH3517447.1 hypothetical protein [Salmonella enterica subsp. enterica serovar Bredeney]EBN0400581.1 hypothetical protein [Salmonella enterica subsp. enterica serovar Montevi